MCWPTPRATVPPRTAPPHTEGCQLVTPVPLITGPCPTAPSACFRSHTPLADGQGQRPPQEACGKQACRPRGAVVMAANDSEAGFMRTAMLLPLPKGDHLGWCEAKMLNTVPGRRGNRQVWSFSSTAHAGSPSPSHEQPLIWPPHRLGSRSRPASPPRLRPRAQSWSGLSVNPATSRTPVSQQAGSPPA